MTTEISEQARRRRNELQRIRRNKNREAVNAYSRDRMRRTRAEKREHVRERERAWEQANKARRKSWRDGWIAENRDRVSALMLAWKKNNPERVRAHAARARARRRRVIVSGEIFTREQIYIRDGGVCYLCGTKVPPLGWHLDHKIPLARGGSHTVGNVGVSCPPCNTRKGSKVVEV